ncbi:diamine N-acetyltransferase [Gammaproteobacteria bacterium]
MQRGRTMIDKFTIRFATKKDVSLIRSFIKDLAHHLKLTEDMVTKDMLRASLFGKNKHAEVILGYYKQKPVGFALFFHKFSTPLGRPGLYLEDLYIKPTMRGKGFGKRLLIFLAKLAKERKCARFEWIALKSDKQAINFYKKNIGAEAKDEWVLFRLENNALDKFATTLL